MVVETISVATDDSTDVLCFELYLINIFAKSAKAERCTIYCLSVTVEDLNF